MGHLNELNKEFSSKGLTVLGVTWEAEKPTEKWVAQHGMEYAYAYDPGGKLKRELGVGGIPHAFLIDPEGIVVWRGHPASLKKPMIEEVLTGSLAAPLWDWPESADEVAEALMDGRFDKALAALEKLEPAAREGLETQVRGLLARRRSTLEAARDAGDWLQVEWRAERLADAAEGLPEQELAEGLLAELKSDRVKKGILKAQEELRKLEAKTDFGKASKLEKSIKKLEKLGDEHAGTIVEREAQERLARWREVLDKLD